MERIIINLDQPPSFILNEYAIKIAELPLEDKITTIIRRILSKLERNNYINWTKGYDWLLKQSVSRYVNFVKSELLDFNLDEGGGWDGYLFDKFSIKVEYNITNYSPKSNNYPGISAIGYVENYQFCLRLDNKKIYPYFSVVNLKNNESIVSIKDYHEWSVAIGKWFPKRSIKRTCVDDLSALVVTLLNASSINLAKSGSIKPEYPIDFVENAIKIFNEVLKGGVNSYWYIYRKRITNDFDFVYSQLIPPKYINEFGIKVFNNVGDFEIVKL